VSNHCWRASSHMASTAATPEAGNNHSEDDTIVELPIVVIGSTGQESIDTPSTRYLLAPSHHVSSSSFTVDIELLWRLRKYLLLLGILAVGVTYNTGLTPPGGFWSKNTQGQSGHEAGDPVLRALFFPRHEVFLYCNATTFAASLVLIVGDHN
jgi:hypothetical protein